MSGSSEQCPYQVLGVGPDSTPRDIKAAYRARALQTHPDRAEPHRRASSEEHFKVILRAYELLSDPVRRAQYDRICTAQLCPAQASTPQSAAPHLQPQPQQQQQQHKRHGKAASTSASSNHAPFPGIPRAFPNSPPAPPPMSGFQTFAWPNQMPAWAPPPSEPPPNFLSRMNTSTKPPAPAFQDLRFGHQPYDEATTLGQPLRPPLHSAFDPDHFYDPSFSGSGKESRQDDWVHPSRFARYASSFSTLHAAPHESGAAWNSARRGQSAAATLPSAPRLSPTARHCFSTFRLSATLTGMRRDDGLVFDGSLHAEYREK